MATTKQPVVDTETGEVLDTDSDQPSDPEVYADIEDQTEAEMAEIEEEMDTEHQVAQASHNVGMRLLSSFIDELTAAGVRRNSDTGFVLERLTRRIKSELRRGYLEIMARDVPTVIASMGKVVLGGDKIQASVVIDKHIDAKNRHALADFAGADVLLVMARDVEEHLADMDSLAKEAAHIQTELDLGEPGIKTVSAKELLAMDLSDVDEQIAAVDAELDLATADLDVKVEKTNIDPSRLIVEDGKVVGVAPDPDCELCAGDGGWDQTVQYDEGDGEPTDEWCLCECVAIPE